MTSAQRAGGVARALSLSPARRAEIARKAAHARWAAPRGPISRRPVLRHRVTAVWDAKRRLWTAESDIPGLVIEAATIPEFHRALYTIAAPLVAKTAGAETKLILKLTVRSTMELLLNAGTKSRLPG